MLQSEIDEISVAFEDAWKEYFGQVMYYVPFLVDQTPVHRVYKESKAKAYDFQNKVLFHGTFKQDPIEEYGEIAGRDMKEQAEVTFVTKELYDKGIQNIDPRALVEITHRDGTIKTYNITKFYGKVQLGDNRVFTKLEVVEIK